MSELSSDTAAFFYGECKGIIIVKINGSKNLKMNSKTCLFWTACLAAGIAAAVLALVPTTRKVGAQLASTTCVDLRDRVEANEKKVVKLGTYVDIKISLDLWQGKLTKIDQAMAVGDVSSDVDAICRLLSCTADGAGTDLESRMKFQRSVRDTLVRAIRDVLKTDAANLSEDLASAKKDLATAQADLLNKRCENIQVLSATYGGNCKAPFGNVTNDLMEACEGKELCSYKVDFTVLKDPVPNCSKDYMATWRCGFNGPVFSVTAAPEAGYGANVILSCEK